MWFQSTPVITDGRTTTPRSSRAGSCRFQSTPVITDGRTAMAGFQCGISWLFQSTPVITDGRTVAAVGVGFAVGMFQSTPVITDGRTGIAFMVGMKYVKFQSTPVITDGRTIPTQPGSRTYGCFNPRPSSLTGEPLRCQSIVDKRLFRAFARTSPHTHRLLRELAWGGEESSFESMACVAREPYREKTITWGSQ